MISVRRIMPIPFILILAVLGCSPKMADQVVLEVGTSKVTLGEYEKFFSRNSGGNDIAAQSTPEDRDHFLDLLTNYKLKLQDAYDRNLLNDSEVVSELKQYRSSLATTFMIDKDVVDPGIHQLYDRRKEYIRAQHILLTVKPDASPEDTLKLYNQAIDIIRRANAGENFDSLAVQNSTDPSAKVNHGDLYYFTSGDMVKAFEDGAYALKKGEISKVPSRSSFGYHIIKVTDREPFRRIKVRHMMARLQAAAADTADSVAALARVKGWQDSLRLGGNFETIATKHSEDAGTATQGGDLGWFTRRSWVQQFDEAAFRLHPGQVSEIVRTPFGYHILRCDSEKTLPPYAEMADELKKMFQQRRYNEAYNEYYDGIKKQFAYSFNDDVFNTFTSVLDTAQTVEDSAWDATVTPEIRKMAMMTINHRSITVDTVIGILTSKPDYRNASLQGKELKQKVDKIAETMLLDEKAADLETRYPAFASLMKEYIDGIVLYRAEQLEVWGKTSVTDSALKVYFAENHAKFMFPERVNIREIFLETDTLALMIYDSLSHGADFPALASRWNDEEELRKNKGERGLVSVETDEVTKAAAPLAVGTISEPIELASGGYAIVQVLAREPAREKTYEEAGAEVSNAYQEYASKQLEQQWLDRVKLAHPVKQYHEVLRNAYPAQQASSPPKSK